MAMPQCCYLAKGAKRPSHTTNTIKFDRIPFESCNSIKRFDLCPFDQKNSTSLQPPIFLDPRKKLQNFLLRSRTENGLFGTTDVISSFISKHHSSGNTLSDKKIVGNPVLVHEQKRSYSLRPTGKLTIHPAKVEEHGNSYSGREDAPQVNPKKEQPDFHC